jgi:TPR repeat protein
VSQNIPKAVPQEYRGCFVQYVDKRSLPEQALNLIGLSSQDVGRSFALIAGVTQYPNLAPEQQYLKPAAEDLRRLQAYLKDQEFFDEIVVLKDGDVTLQALRYFLEVYFPARVGQFPKSRFLFAYSGHGMTEGSAEYPFGYLLQSTARNLQDKENGISMRAVRTFVDSIVEAGHHVLVLINACHSGAFLNNRPFGDTSTPYLPREKGAHAITASGAGQASWHNPQIGTGSVFFETFFAGLGGQADAYPIDARTRQHGDGIITAHELGTYLVEEVRLATQGEQTPIPADISLHRSRGAFFFLNRQKQIARGIVPDWDRSQATPLGLAAEQDLVKAKSLYTAKDYDSARSLFTQAANAGNAEAMSYLGYMYAAGRGGPQDYQQARQWYEKAATAGNTMAMQNLGWLYKEGQGGAQDYRQARQWYEKAAAAGDANAMRSLGWLYDQGLGVSQDYQQARQWYEKAAAAGDARAMNHLGGLYRKGQGVSQDYQQARQWYEKAAAAGNTNAMENLAWLYREGKGVSQDYQQARQWYEKAAAAGDASAMRSLGWLYDQGLGVSQDYQQARQWYEKAAAAGNAQAMNHLGGLYRKGQGVSQDYQQARQWYEKAAAAGNANAMENLAWLYREGKGVSQNYRQARQWYEKAIAAGDTNAMSSLGELYRDGKGVSQNYRQARQWFEKAAAAGNAIAMQNLGWLYREGKGVSQDYRQARQWYEKAAAAGNVIAMENLGWLYREGKGVPQDYGLARQWYEKAAAHGSKDAKTRLQELRK